MLTVAEVAQELRVCKRSVRRWIDQEELRHHQFGRAIRVSRQDLDDFKRTRRK
jgi:excisionase family DNA binding protein